jgi:phosphoserine phosphatase RsbU/P
VEADLRRAAEVQRGLLPRAVPELPGWDFAGVCVPSRDVGGDFFDWHAGAGGVVVTLADVMGKGMGGALVMATVRAVLRGTGRLDSLGEAVDLASATLVQDLQETSSFVTLLHARVSPDGVLRYVDAGHGLAAVVRADGVDRLGERGLPVGILEDASWTEGTTTLATGDALVAFSDGLLDLRGDPSTDEEVAALLEEVAAVVRTAPSSREAVAALSAGATDMPDDVTVVVVRRCA